MHAKALLMAASVLVLVTLACRPAGTPTLEPGAFETTVAQTVWAEMVASGPTDTPPPVVTDTLTSTPLPPTDTPSPSATPPAPTETPVPIPTETPVPCAIAAAPEFEARLNTRPDVLSALGCPTNEPQQTWAAEERFEHGRMFWQHDTDLVHILDYDGGAYWLEEDQYIEGDPEDACPEVGDAPGGLFKPVRGFNWHWCNTAGVRDALGWAVENELGYEAVWQEFEGGHALQSRANHVYIFYSDGTWGYIE